ncbi:hypothetical protein EIL87_01615 [Saccharopolyspora rhizosphaerae]|uniref:Tellurium resistance protein TerC n=1 Tax=Saccharopolyspora rhizosphaerae TaxID=2492662 RepID=A0A426K5D8_9PSEU|nr:hypothetical protein [Saccharopolyspora rhizosphaerae]RRO20598.1 hypothetical protein EIL87_01615 [Saccharopolyspora rhizosphaerae]
MSVPALFPSAAVAVLLAAVAADLLACARGRAPTRHDLPVIGSGIAAALLLALGTSFAAPALAGEFLAAWGSAWVLTVDLVVLLVVLTHRAPGAERLVAVAVGASVLTRALLVTTGVPGVAWLSALFGLVVLAGSWWLFRHGERGLPEAGPAALIAIPVAVVLGAFAVAAGGAGVLVLCANLLALLGAVRLVRLTARVCVRVPDVAVAFSAVLVFVGFEALLTGLAGGGPAQDVSVTVLCLSMTVLVVLLSAITAVRAGR